LKITQGYRRWALEHPVEYTLIFGTGVECCGEATKEEMYRGIAVLFRVMISGLDRGVIHPPPLAPRVERKLRPKLQKWNDELGFQLPPEALGACMFVWAQLHGAISLELIGHMPPQLLPADDLFEHVMYEVLRTIGCDLEDNRGK